MVGSNVVRSSYVAHGQLSSARECILSKAEQAGKLKPLQGNSSKSPVLHLSVLKRSSVKCQSGANSNTWMPSEMLPCRFCSGRGVGTLGRRSSIPRGPQSSRIQARKTDASNKEEPPNSREQALQQARTSLSLLLEKALQKQNKKTKDRGGAAKGPRLTVELPVLDTSPSSTLKLTRDVFQSLVNYKVRDTDMAFYFGDSETARSAMGVAANPRGWLMQPLNDASTVPDRASLIILVGPREEQLPVVDKIVDVAGARPIVALNPEWYPEGVIEESSAVKTVADSFDVCYSYLPLKIQGFFGTSEGAVLKFVTSGAPGGAPWLIFVKEKEEFKVAIKLKKRPNAGDLEQAFYIKSASESPVAKSVNFVRGLASMITGK